MNVAITGIIGSGKSFVSKELSRLLDADYCDTDKVCRDFLQKDNDGWRGVAEKWGDTFFDVEGRIDTVRLREAIFDSVEIRQQLENILHPLVRRHVEALKKDCISKGKNLVVEVPLLFEVGWQSEFDVVITVYSDIDTCLNRIVSRDGVSRQQALKTIRAQMDIEEKVRLADHVVNSSSSKEHTLGIVKDLATVLRTR